MDGLVIGMIILGFTMLIVLLCAMADTSRPPEKANGRQSPSGSLGSDGGGYYGGGCYDGGDSGGGDGGGD